MRGTKKPISKNKHQHKLIVLTSTINYMNLNFEQYTQKNILHYFNGNLKRNGQKEVKLKTLQSYLYKLEKIFKVTINYHRHLGVNMGTEIHYELKYSKQKCYYIINKHFRDKKQNKHKDRVNDYLKKTCIKNGSVEKWECSYNIYNKKEEEINEIKQSIEKLQIKKYAKKCNFKSKEFLSILNLKIDKNTAIEMLKVIKRTENSIEKNKHEKSNDIKPNKNKMEDKQRKLNKILNKTKISLENEGYNSNQLEAHIQNIYNQYKNKPHFIIESNKYDDLSKIITNLKKTFEHDKINIKKNEKNIRNNIFSILLDQLKHKVHLPFLVPIIKTYLRKQNKLDYGKILNNHYYYELLMLVEDKKMI